MGLDVNGQFWCCAAAVEAAVFIFLPLPLPLRQLKQQLQGSLREGFMDFLLDRKANRDGLGRRCHQSGNNFGTFGQLETLRFKFVTCIYQIRF